MQQQVYELRPLDGIGPIKLGMTREEARNAIEQVPITFQKSPLSVTETDAYHDSAFQVFFDEQERVEFIEISRVDDIAAVFGEVDLLHTPAQEVVFLLSATAEFDSSDPELGYTYVFPKLQLALWRPALPEETGGFEGRYFSTVGIGRAGYFAR